jgi:ADP-ribose pyrophosphatase YjhB (NUDIX family)
MWNLGAFAIIFDAESRVLLCHRRDMDAWNLPGGGIEHGELPTEAVLREVIEETGLEVSIERLLGVYGKVDNPSELVFSFLCRVTGGQLVLTDESDDIRYFEVESIPPNTSPRQVERIHEALSQPSQPVFRRLTAPSTREMLSSRKLWESGKKKKR